MDSSASIAEGRNLPKNGRFSECPRSDIWRSCRRSATGRQLSLSICLYKKRRNFRSRGYTRRSSALGLTDGPARDIRRVTHKPQQKEHLRSRRGWPFLIDGVDRGRQEADPSGRHGRWVISAQRFLHLVIAICNSIRSADTGGVCGPGRTAGAGVRPRRERPRCNRCGLQGGAAVTRSGGGRAGWGQVSGLQCPGRETENLKN
jgi:hypothetical protein